MPDPVLMPRKLLKTRRVVTMNPSFDCLEGGGVIVQGSLIERVVTENELGSLSDFNGETVDATSLTLIPGFIQTHIHLCQTIFRGLADDLELLDWLQVKIFPMEAAHNSRSMFASAMAGIAELMQSGTTAILDMGSIHHEEEVVRAVEESGMRAFIGKAMMDVNELYPPLRESTRDALMSSRQLAERWHNAAGGRIRYAVAPRFVLSCSDALLQGAYEMTRSFDGMLFHTHASENRREMEAVRQRCSMDNIEYFAHLGVLHNNTCLAHCIWLNDREMGLLQDHSTNVVHCPSSNMKLGSGIARVPEMLSKGINVSLGADGAPCNNTLDMFHEMRAAALIQKPIHGPATLDARTVFAMATRGGARALGIDAEVGSIESGKKADLVLLDLDEIWNPYEDDGVYGTIVYSGARDNVHSVMIDGHWVYRNHEHVTVDANRARDLARTELRLLKQRVQ